MLNMVTSYASFAETEKKYIDRLEILQLKLTQSSKIEFAELSQQVETILCTHHKHYENLISNDDPHETFETYLIEWATGIRPFYEKYIESLAKLSSSSCQEIVPSALWQPSFNSTPKKEEPITIEAPLQQLETYKYLFEQAHQANIIHKSTLQQLDQDFDKLMNSIPVSLKPNPKLLHNQIDCTRVIAFNSGDHIEDFQLTPFSKILLCNIFECIELDRNVQLILTIDELIFCFVENDRKLSLLYTPISIDAVMVRPVQDNTKNQACFQLWINKQSIFTMRSELTELCNMWLSDLNCNSANKDSKRSDWKTLEETAANHCHQFMPKDKILHKNTSRPTIRTEDALAFSSSCSEKISPLAFSDEELTRSKNEAETNEDTKMSADRNLIPFAEQKSVPSTTGTKPSIVLNSQLAPNRKHSLSNPPIPAYMSSSGIISPENRVPTIRTVSSYQSIGDARQQQNLQASLPPQKDNTLSPPKRMSFMRSVVGAISNRTSLRPKKSSNKLSINDVYNHQGKSITKSLSAVTLSQQQQVQPDNGTQNQHLHLPSRDISAQKRNSASLPSFPINPSTSEQCSPASTPSLSRASSTGGSVTPVRHTPSSSSSEGFDLPSETLDANAIRAVLYSNDQCQVFRWKDESWYAVEGDCLLEVRQTHAARSYTFIIRTTETDLSLSLNIVHNQRLEVENYLFHCQSKEEADRLTSLLEQLHRESVRLNNLKNTSKNSLTDEQLDVPPTPTATVISQEEIAKSFKLIMQCKCKLYVQNASSNWSSFGSVYMKVSQNHNTKRMHISMESHKGEKITQLVSAMIQSRNVERLSPKRITFLLVDEFERSSVVYMIQVREETTSDKIIEYTKIKNAENGW
ncbi:hypothetical protein EDC96DRAFT_492341 [Choanephora cucurbitarum]|nr:hypothetical protein EDC96DRAFT_492341 [Choanephora cucurbitarum]